MMALGSCDSWSTLSWNRCLTEMCWTHKMCEGLCVAFHHLFNLKEDCFKGLIIELRHVSREQKLKKKIDLCYHQSHALQFTLQGDAVSPWGKSCQKCWKWSACFLLKLTCREALVFRDLNPCGGFTNNCSSLFLREVEIRNMTFGS